MSESILKTKIVSDFEEFCSLERDWNSLLKNSFMDSPFLCHEWFRVWWKNFVLSTDRVFIVCVYKQVQLIAVAPLIFLKEKGYLHSYNTLQLMANSHSMRCDFILDRNHDPVELIECIWKMISREKWDYLKLRDVTLHKNESRTIETLQKLVKQKGRRLSLEEARYSPYIEIDGNWEEYLGKLKGHFRRNLKRRQRKLNEEVGESRVVKIDSRNSGYEKLLEDGFQVEASGWKGKTRSAIQLNEKVHGFYRELASVALDKGWLRLYYLYAAEKLLAFDFCLIYNHRFYLLKIGYDESFGRYSPGQLLKYTEIEECFGKRLEEYDFLGQTMPWKMDWTSDIRPQYTVFIYGASLLGKWKYFLNVKVLPALREQPLLRKVKEKYLG